METWNDMHENEDFYEVSSAGRIRSKDRMIIRRNGRHHTVRSKILSPSKDAKGYLRTMVSTSSGHKTIKVHREVLKAFDPIDHHASMECNHKNGNKEDNNILNLEWMTRAENIAHSFDTGLQDNFKRASAKRCYSLRKLNYDQYQSMFIDRNDGFSFDKLANKYGMDKKTIQQAIKGNTYRDFYARF